MRKILFRGQTRRKGEKVYMSGAPVPSNWVYGGVAQSVPDRDFSIIYQIEPEIKKYPVYADTVSQYTGLNDSEGNRIFEGDILSFHGNDNWSAVVEFGRSKHSNFYSWGFYLKPITVPEHESVLDILLWISMEGTGIKSKVIGNIYDNPELLKGNE